MEQSVEGYLPDPEFGDCASGVDDQTCSAAPGEDCSKITLQVCAIPPAPCTQPTNISFSQTAATCTGLTALNDGTIRLASQTGGTHYGISTLNATSYDGVPFSSAMDIPSSLPAVIQSNVPNTGGTYILRIYNGSLDCYSEETVTVDEVICVAARVCEVSITNLKTSSCYYLNGNSYSTVSMEINWQEPPSNGVISITLDGQTKNITPGTINVTYEDGQIGTQTVVSPQIMSFDVIADGSNKVLTAGFNAGCQTSTSITTPNACTPTPCEGNLLGGMVFNDYDANGFQATDESFGLEGVTVEAFACDGTTYNTTTDLFGQYLLDIPVEKYPVRIEFSGLPNRFGEGTPQGTTNGTTTQFADGPVCNLNLGILDPSDFCQAAPTVIVPCYINGSLSNSQVSNLEALVGFDYNASGLKNEATIVKLASASQVGSVWGVAYNKRRKEVFSSAILKRHAALGPAGLGGIYSTDIANYPSATTSIFIDVITDLGINVGTVSSNADRGITGGPSSPSRDNEGFVNSAKIGIGDIDLSEDGKTLYFTNLFDKKLYAVDITAYNVDGTKPTASSVLSYDLNLSCSGGDLRPWAIKVYKNKVYVGAVCDGNGGQKSDLRAFVVAFDALNNFSQEIVLEFPLTHPKGFSMYTYTSETGWYPWTDDWLAKRAGSGFSSNDMLHPEPILGDIEFDIDGSIILGINDRTGLQTGNANSLKISGINSMSRNLKIAQFGGAKMSIINY